MTAPSFHTARLHGWITRMQAGDLEAREELLRCVGGRLERLARAMLRRFPAVADLEESGDVYVMAVMRLLDSLREVRPDSTRAFFGLATLQTRRVLLDLVRRARRLRDLGGNPNGHARPHDDGSGAATFDPVDTTDDPDDLERWEAFHLAVEELPAKEREVVNLIFYHGWTQAEVAELLQVTDRAVRRYWRSASVKLYRELKGALPEGEGEVA